MKKTDASLLFIAGAALALSACNMSDKYAADSIAFNRVEMQKSYRLDNSAADYERPEDISYGCQASILMPTALYGKPVEVLQDSILMTAFGTTGPDHARVIADAMLREVKELQYEVSDTVMPDSIVAEQPFLSRYDGFSSVEGDVETLTPRILSYAVTSSQYLPSAAHGMYGTRYINYDLEEGVIVTLKDLFTTEGLAELPQIIRSTAQQMKEVIGPTEIESVPADDNFYLTAGGEIVFAYQPYEVASYAQGEVQIPIPAYLLSQSLTPTGLRILLNQ